MAETKGKGFWRSLALRLWQKFILIYFNALATKIKVFIVCIILPIIFFGVLIYEAIKEYRKNPVEFIREQLTLILLLSVSLAIFYYFWRNYHQETPKIKSKKETIQILR